MSSRRGFMYLCTRFLAVLMLLTAFIVIAPPQTALADIATFAIATPGSNGTFPDNMTVADFNGDGIPDLAIANQTSGNIAIKIGNGDGTFHDGTSVNFPIINFVYGADADGDGKIDLIDFTSQIISGGNVTKINVRLGNGDGTFGSTTKTTILPFFSNKINFADFNGDGTVDAALDDLFNNKIWLIKGVGDGTFTQPTNFSSGGTNPFDVIVSDVNGDGKPDLLVANSVSASIAAFFNTGNDGSGNPQFTPAVGSPYSLAAGMMPVALTVIAGAGAGGGPDIAVVAEPTTNPTTTPGTLTTLLYNGTNGFTAGSPVNIGILPSGVKAGGFTGSGNTDVAVSYFPSTPGGIGSVAVYAGNGIGGFATTAVATIPTGHGSKPLVVGDFNRDGKPDVVVPNADDNTLTVGTNTTTPSPHLKPSLFDIFPIQGPRSGGATLTIKGAGFQPGAVVRLLTGGPTQGLNGLNVVVSPDGTTITCTTPNFFNSQPIVRVIVVNLDGGSTDSDVGGDFYAHFYRLTDPPAPAPPKKPENPIPNVQPGALPLADPPVACNVSPCNPTNLPVGRPASA